MSPRRTRWRVDWWYREEMRWLALVVALGGCDALFRIDGVSPPPAPPVDAARAPDGAADAAPLDAFESVCAHTTVLTKLCADFDTPTTGLTRFMGVATIGSGSIEVVPASTTTSLPDALRATLSSTGALNQAAIATYDTGNPAFAGAIDFDVQVSAFCSPTIFRMTYSNATLVFSFNQVSNDFVLAWSVPTGNCSASTMIPNTPFSWSHVKIDVNGPSGTASAHVGPNVTTQLTCDQTAGNTGPVVELGARMTVIPESTCQILIDTVRVTATL